MTTFVDTNILVYLLDPNSPFHGWAKEAFAERREKGPIIISDIVYCELSVNLDSVAGRAEWICINPGIRAHLLLMAEILKHLDAKGVIDAHLVPEDALVKALSDFVSPITNFIKTASTSDLEPRFSRKFGEGGVLEYYYALCELLVSKHKDFGSPEFKAYLSRQKDAQAGQARQDVLDLVQVVMDVTVDVLKSLYGSEETASGEKAYWELGVDNIQIKSEAYKKQQMASREKRVPKEAYLDLIDCEKIFKQPGNWDRFSQVFNIPLEGTNRRLRRITWIGLRN